MDRRSSFESRVEHLWRLHPPRIRPALHAIVHPGSVGLVGQTTGTSSTCHWSGGTVYQTPQGALFGLRPVGSTEFDSTRTGLDHISFAVSSRADLDNAEKSLSDAGIKHGQIKDLKEAEMAILSFQDPDDINVELTAPLQ